MNRREWLRGAAAAAVLSLFAPLRAEALGGTLPGLDQPAPGFDLDGVAPASGRAGADVRQFRLEQFRGDWLVLYFFPRDFTGGCTLEARDFQKHLSEFRRRGAQVAGISADDADSHVSFSGSEGLRFPLLSDPGGSVSRAYGSWLPPFSLRHTFLIDPDGVLRARWTAVRPAGHADQVLAELARLKAA